MSASFIDRKSDLFLTNPPTFQVSQLADCCWGRPCPLVPRPASSLARTRINPPQDQGLLQNQKSVSRDKTWQGKRYTRNGPSIIALQRSKIATLLQRMT